ncbi:MAG: methionyl-tRNA formyltransferase [Gammaproteobacteria bacterium]|nr:methionyl-tRNA formyltransferase [Gammaproteobacteria bacterium]
MPMLKIIYAGTPDFSVAALQALIDSEHEVVAVYTQPDRPAGRGRKLTPSPVKQLALENDIAVYQPLNFKAQQDRQQLIDLKADLMVVAAYGLILPEAILAAPRLGCINIHASILPRWRGAAPIQRAILAGDKETGITIMQMDIGLDTGDMLSKSVCEINNDMTASQLHDRLMEMGGRALMEIMPAIENQTLEPEKQDEALVTYAEKLQKIEAKINWQHSAELIARQIRAFNAWPVSQTVYDNKVMRIWQAHVVDASELTASNTAQPGQVIAVQKKAFYVMTGDGVLALTEIQMPGKKPMPAAAFLNAHDPASKILGLEAE